MPKLAIIGTGIAGMGCAHFLHRHFDLTLFEQHDYAGGHTHTVTASEPGTGREVPIDTGFMVFNHATYPLLTRLFRDLDVATKKTAMSFSVRHADSGLEFAGSSLNHLFAQRRNLFRPRFYRMLGAISRFNAEAVPALDDPATQNETLGEYVKRRGYGDDFYHLYLVPMSSAVWSTPPELMLGFPATSLLRFFHNHGFLGLDTQHQWWTVEGGARRYVEKITEPWRDRIRLGQAATHVIRTPRGVTVMTSAGVAQNFDHVILACHGDQALKLIDNPTIDEARLLGEFHYQPNIATLHTDTAVMPRTRLAWSSWNYEIARGPGGVVSTATHYWMNSLQGVSDRENYFVTINRPESIAPGQVIRRISYEHPLFSLGAVRAQAEMPALNRAAAKSTQTFFAGAWQRYGFHEDGLLSAHTLCEQILGRDPWPA
ncbi:MAG: transhydrogenase subunit alpha [Verrucomicrobia bacterium]|nr:transhydrogenase subunit alpha [Verrucomicrobiota bacterium]